MKFILFSSQKKKKEILDFGIGGPVHGFLGGILIVIY